MMRISFILVCIAAVIMTGSPLRAEAVVDSTAPTIDYNTLVVVLGTSLLGAICGFFGPFLLLSRRALLGDVVAHATLPGIAGMFIVLVYTGFSPRSIPLLLTGACISGGLAVVASHLIRTTTRLKEDVIQALVLSVFFGFGVVLMGVATRLGQGNSAGLNKFLFGQAASLLFNDVVLVLTVGSLALATTLIWFRELTLLCFDRIFCLSTGLPVQRLDALLLGLTILLVVTGLQSVGLILVVAFLVIPAASALCWSYHLPTVCLLGATFGAVSGLAGSLASAMFDQVPAGAAIVLVAAFIFTIGTLFSPWRGIIPRLLRRSRQSIVGVSAP